MAFNGEIPLDIVGTTSYQQRQVQSRKLDGTTIECGFQTIEANQG